MQKSVFYRYMHIFQREFLVNLSDFRVFIRGEVPIHILCFPNDLISLTLHQREKKKISASISIIFSKQQGLKPRKWFVHPVHFLNCKQSLVPYSIPTSAQPRYLTPKLKAVVINPSIPAPRSHCATRRHSLLESWEKSVLFNNSMRAPPGKVQTQV